MLSAVATAVLVYWAVELLTRGSGPSTADRTAELEMEVVRSRVAYMHATMRANEAREAFLATQQLIGTTIDAQSNPTQPGYIDLNDVLNRRK